MSTPTARSDRTGTARRPRSLFERLRARREELRLVGSLVVLCGLAVPLVGLFRRGWTDGPENATRTLVTTIAAVGPPMASLQALATGSLLVVLGLLVVDRRKRVQGLLLWLATLLVAVGFAVNGFVPRVFDHAGRHLPGLLAGAALTLVALVPSSVARSLARLESPSRLEFRRAPRALAWATTVAVGLSWFEAHVVYPNVFGWLLGGAPLVVPSLLLGVDTAGIVVDTLAGAAFVGLTWQFVAYESHTEVVLVGAKGAGKTMGACGAYLAHRDRRGDATDASRHLREHVEELETGTVIDRPGAEAPVSEWPLDETDTDDIAELSFDVERGRLFPRTLTVRTLDYPGEALSAVARVVGGEAPEDVDSVATDTLRELSDTVEAADVLVFLVDVERVLADDERVAVSDYTPLVRAYRDEKRFVVAATKADLFDDAYTDRYGARRDPYETAELPRFARFVTDELERRSGSVTALLSEADVDTVHPVYFMTDEYEGERLPVLENGTPKPFGYRRLVDALR